MAIERFVDHAIPRTSVSRAAPLRSGYRSLVGRALALLVVAATPGAIPASAEGADWPQWGGRDGRNMVSAETGLPDSFVPGDKLPSGGRPPRATCAGRLGSARRPTEI